MSYPYVILTGNNDKINYVQAGINHVQITI